jgi:hypothetical protein
MKKNISGLIFCALSIGMFCTTAIAQTNGVVIKKKYFPDKSAEFKGGYAKFITYLQKNFKCKSGNDGKVFIAFVIDSAGGVKPESIYFVKSGSEGIMSEECKKRLIETLENSPKWLPAFNNEINKEVECNMILPFNFK